MTTPETEIIRDILGRIAALRVSLEDAIGFAGPVPVDDAAFAGQDKLQRVASTALIKIVEQLEDQLARLFRTILQALAVDTTGWFAQDTANRMEQLGIVADAATWVDIVKLRNRLVHDYPLRPEAQLSRLREAHAAASVLNDSAEKVVKFLTDRGLL